MLAARRQRQDTRNAAKRNNGLDRAQENELMAKFGLERRDPKDKENFIRDEGEVLRQYRDKVRDEEEEDRVRENLVEKEAQRDTALAKERGHFDHHAELEDQRRRMLAEE